MRLRHLIRVTEAVVILTVAAMALQVWRNSESNRQTTDSHWARFDSIVAVNARDATLELLTGRRDSVLDIRRRCGPLLPEC